MSTAIEAAFEAWLEQRRDQDGTKYITFREAFTAGFDLAAKANTELIKEYQETMEKIDGNT